MTEEVGITEAVDTSAQPLIDVDPAPPATAADDKKTETGATDETAKEETPEQQEVKKESRRQRKLTRERDLRVAAETEARLLREQLAARDAKPAAQQDGEPQRDQFEDYEAYLDAKTEYKAKQVAAATLKADSEARQGKETQTKQAAAQDEMAKSWVEREKAFISATPDYEAMVTPYVEEDLGQLSDGARRLILDAGPALLDHLARNPDEHDRIAALSPLRQIAELGKIEGKLDKPAAEKTEAAPNKISKAPAPIRPMTGGKSASNGYSENMNDREYREWRKSQGARWAN